MDQQNAACKDGISQATASAFTREALHQAHICFGSPFAAEDVSASFICGLVCFTRQERLLDH